MPRSLVILGSGGHAKVVIATAQAAGFIIEKLLDDDTSRHGAEVLGVRVAGRISLEAVGKAEAVIGIGSNAVRKKLALLPFPWATVVHPSATVHASVAIGAGSVVFAHCVVQPDTQIGAHVIMNTASHIDHDGHVGDYAHIAPGAALCGGVRLGEGVMFGVGASAIPGVSVGDWTVVGGGAAVVCDLPSNSRCLGVPAKPV